jgi:hypothetical protein
MDQVLGALAHHQFDGGRRHRRQVEIAQHAVQGFGEIAERVDHGAVEVDDGGVEVGVIEVGGRVQDKPMERVANGRSPRRRR